MPRYQKILVPHDFSASADAALAAALDLAVPLGASVHVVHVYHSAPHMYAHYTIDPPDPAVVKVPEAAMQRLAAELDRTRAAGVDCDGEVRDGIPDEEIVKAATEQAADLIVMGTRGHSGLRHVVLGSVAERTLRTAPCPVMTVRTED
jgi:nucleotide-binding universal stress UspA family protein